MSPPVLREARLEDLEALYRLDALCFEPGIAYTRDDLRRFLRLETARSVFAEIGGEVAGFALGYRPRQGVAHVLTLDVHPRFRRRGLGEALLREVLSQLAEDGAKETRLEVDVTNAAAITFYERLGFRTLRRLENYYAAGRPALEMGLTSGSLPKLFSGPDKPARNEAPSTAGAPLAPGSEVRRDRAREP